MNVNPLAFIAIMLVGPALVWISFLLLRDLRKARKELSDALAKQRAEITLSAQRKAFKQKCEEQSATFKERYETQLRFLQESVMSTEVKLLSDQFLVILWPKKPYVTVVAPYMTTVEAADSVAAVYAAKQANERVFNTLDTRYRNPMAYPLSHTLNATIKLEL